MEECLLFRDLLGVGCGKRRARSTCQAYFAVLGHPALGYWVDWSLKLSPVQRSNRPLRAIVLYFQLVQTLRQEL